MWTRSWTGCFRRTLSGGLVALLLAGTAIVPPSTARAQEQLNEAPEPDPIDPPEFDATNFDADDVDPVTRIILTNALLSLRLIAIVLLEDPQDVGLAQSGVVRGYLARREFPKAVEVAGQIEDPIWKARSNIWVSDYVARVGGEEVAARQWLDRALEITRSIEDPWDGGETLGIVALRLIELGDLDAATAVATTLPDQDRRTSALLAVADDALSQDITAARRAAAATALRGAADEIMSSDLRALEKAARLVDIGGTLLRADDPLSANRLFESARELIDREPDEERFRAYVQLAEGMVEAGNQRGGMIVVRLIPEGAQRARALAAVAAAIGRRNLDAAVPLFRLANEELPRVEDQEERFDVIAFIVEKQTEVGRLADAFEASSGITERLPQAQALLGMGQVLIGQGKLREALVLKDFIPFVGMRAQIMAPVAEGRGLEEDPDGASALLAEALDPTGFPFQPSYIPDALDAVLRAQVRYGQPDFDQAIFSRARSMAQVLPDDLARVKALVKLAIAEARRGRIDDAQKTISAAYRGAFENRDSDGFDEALMEISLAQLAAGDLLGAYDTAARIPEPPPGIDYPRTEAGGFDVPRYQALIRVAAASGRLGDSRFGIDVTAKIGHEPARAIGLAAVAIATASQTTDLIDVIDDIQSGDLLSPDYDYLTQAQEMAPLEEENDLGAAPTLAPLDQ